MAHWIIEDKGFGGSYYRCSNCGEVYWDILQSKEVKEDKCPNCCQPINDDETEYIDVKTEYTNLDFIHSASASQLADLFMSFDFYLKADRNRGYNFDDKEDWIAWLNESYKGE